MRIRAFVLGTALLLGLINSPAQAQTSSPLDLLDLVTIAEESNEFTYDRNEFKHWVDTDQDGCDTRKEVLKAESTVKAKIGKGCEILSGKWLSQYDNKVFTKASQLDIDHLVPLKEAWESGASAWTDKERELFANDLGYRDSLLAVSASTNRSKGDRDPSDWQPANKKFACQYAVSWVSVKFRWSLSIDLDEYSSLYSMLSKCSQRQLIQVPAQIPVTSPSEANESPEPTPSPTPSPTATSTPTPTPTPTPTSTPAPTSTPTPSPSPSNSGLPRITPGAFCAASAAGTQGVGSNGQIYTCKTSPTDSRYRWRL